MVCMDALTQTVSAAKQVGLSGKKVPWTTWAAAAVALSGEHPLRLLPPLNKHWECEHSNDNNLPAPRRAWTMPRAIVFQESHQDLPAPCRTHRVLCCLGWSVDACAVKLAHALLQGWPC